MNYDEFETKLRGQTKREIPPEWRREILEPLRREEPESLPWWRAWLWPHPTAWASLAAAWVLIVGLNMAAEEGEGPVQQAATSAPEVQQAYEERQRLYAEVMLELAPAQRAQPADRPRSDVMLEEATV